MSNISGWLPGLIGPLVIQVNGVNATARGTWNFIGGVISAVDDEVNDTLQITFSPGSAGGSDTQIQYSNAGTLAGAANMTYVGGYLTLATALKLKNGSYTTSLASGTLAGNVTLTLPASTCTLVGQNTTDTLTNKTVVLASNTITDTSAALGDLVKHNGTRFVRFAKGSAYQVPRVKSDGSDLEFSAVDLATAQITGILPTGNIAVTLTGKTLTTATIAAASNAVSGFVDPGLCGLRPTLTTTVPVTTSDVTGATNIYFTPYRSGAISLWNGTQWVVYTTAEITLPLGTLTSGKNYDVYAYQNAGVVTLEISGAWSNDTTPPTRGTQDGVLIKSGDPTRKLVFSFRTTSTTTTADAVLTRFLSSLYNAVPREMSVVDPTDTWTYVNPGQVWRQARATTSNKFEYLCCEPRALVADVSGTANVGGAGSVCVGIGIDSTSSNSAKITNGRANATSLDVTMSGAYRGTPALGYHAVNWLETGQSGVATYTFYGDNGTTIMQSGMVGVVAG